MSRWRVRLVVKFLAVSVFYLALPILSYLAGYDATRVYFERFIVPLPFEKFGIVFGLSAAFFSLGAVETIRVIFSSITRNRSSAYSVENKNESLLKVGDSK